MAGLLTILLTLWLSDSDKLLEALVLVTCHCAVTTTFQRQIELEMRVQVLLQCLVPHESHTANAAVEFDSLEDFNSG